MEGGRIIVKASRSHGSTVGLVGDGPSSNVQHAIAAFYTYMASGDTSAAIATGFHIHPNASVKVTAPSAGQTVSVFS